MQALRAEGGDPGSSIHGWRCAYPDRYGPCDCLAESAAGILAAIRPLIEAEVRAEADGLADALDIARAERAGLREAVARELDAKALRWRTRRDATDDFGRGTYYSGLALAYDDAARIARGGYEGTGSDD